MLSSLRCVMHQSATNDSICPRQRVCPQQRVSTQQSVFPQYAGVRQSEVLGRGMQASESHAEDLSRRLPLRQGLICGEALLVVMFVALAALLLTVVFADTGTASARKEVFDHPIRTLQCTGDSNRFVVGFDDLVCVWNRATEQKETIWVREGMGQCIALASAAAANAVVILDLEGSLTAIDTELGRQLWSRHYIAHDVNCVAISADGSKVAIGMFAGALSLLDGKTGELLKTWHSQQHLASIRFTADDQHLVSSGDRGIICHHRIDTDAVTVLDSGFDEIYGVMAVDPEGQFVAAANCSGTLIVWDMQTKTVLRREQAVDIGILSIAFTPHGQIVAGAVQDATTLWTRQLEPVSRFAGHRSATSTIAVTSGEIFSSGYDGWIVSRSLADLTVTQRCRL